MIEHELLFLGLLAEGPKHGYEIKQKIREELGPLIGLTVKSIYYPLQKMEQAGLVEKCVGREGRWPQKNVYGITKAGQRKFDALIGESFLSIQRPFFHMDLALYFLPLANQPGAKRRLRARLTLLQRVARELAALRDGSAGRSKSGHLILQHDSDLVHAEIASTERLIRQL